MNKKPRTAPCPTCKQPVVWTEAARWRPFCSKRCQLIDLGEWFNEEHRIPSKTTPWEQS